MWLLYAIIALFVIMSTIFGYLLFEESSKKEKEDNGVLLYSTLLGITLIGLAASSYILVMHKKIVWPTQDLGLENTELTDFTKPSSTLDLYSDQPTRASTLVRRPTLRSSPRN